MLFYWREIRKKGYGCRGKSVNFDQPSNFHHSRIFTIYFRISNKISVSLCVFDSFQYIAHDWCLIQEVKVTYWQPPLVKNWVTKKSPDSGKFQKRPGKQGRD